MSDYLNSLSLPGDLKDMSYDELELLTYEIRCPGREVICRRIWAL